MEKEKNIGRSKANIRYSTQGIENFRWPPFGKRRAAKSKTPHDFPRDPEQRMGRWPNPLDIGGGGGCGGFGRAGGGGDSKIPNQQSRCGEWWLGWVSDGNLTNDLGMLIYAF